MAPHHLALVIALAIVGVAAPRAQQAATAPSAVLTDAAIEEFLQTARISEARQIGIGTTDSVRATLQSGTLTHDAHIQTVDVAKQEFRGKGVTERNFRDSWRFNVAAYRIDRLLGLQLVPVSIERRWKGEAGAFTWWVDDVMMDEGGRLKKNLSAPDSQCWEEQAHLVRMFDQLIDNADRNLGNLLITSQWRMWAIDHTRAFRYGRTPRNVATLTGIDRTILARLEALDFRAVKDAVDGYIGDADIRNLLARRDVIVAHFKKRGEAGLYDRRDPAKGCTE